MANNKIGEVYGQGVPNQTIKGHPLVVGTNFVGVEIELEGIPDQPFQSQYWNMKGDGSLRNNGQEFVCKGPTGGLDLFNAVVEIDRFLFDKNPDGNWRCSTHVHLDVRDMTASELKNLIVIYLMMEKIIFRLSGFHRYKNNFCCSIGFAQNQLHTLINHWEEEDTYGFTNNLIQRWDKYSALNLVPISSFGTVEFRMSEPKWRKGRLLLLCNRFLAMKELAKSWQGTHQELVEYLMTTDLFLIFKKGLPKEIPANCQEDLEVGFKLVNDLLVLSKEPVFLGNRPVRNNGENASNIWNAIPRRDRRHIPLELYTDDSPKVSLQRLWPQIKALCERHDLVIHDALQQEMNYSTARWYEQRLDLVLGTLPDPEDKDAYCNYFRDNNNFYLKQVRAIGEACDEGGLRIEEEDEVANVDIEAAPAPRVPLEELLAQANLFNGIEGFAAAPRPNINWEFNPQAFARWQARANGGEVGNHNHEVRIDIPPPPAPPQPADAVPQQWFDPDQGLDMPGEGGEEDDDGFDPEEFGEEEPEDPF